MNTQQQTLIELPLANEAPEPATPPAKDKKQWFIVVIESDIEYFYWRSATSNTEGFIPMSELGKPYKPKRWKMKSYPLAMAREFKNKVEIREWVE